MMIFSERKRLAEEYEEWVKQPLSDGSTIKDCPLSVITFLNAKGVFKDREDTVQEIWQFINDYDMSTPASKHLFRLRFGVKKPLTERQKIAKEIIDKVDDMVGGEMIALALREIYLEVE